MPKNISGSVGQGGKNFPKQDVMTVQYLLNCVPTSKGGPSPELVVDGIIGPKTLAAIKKFQTAQFGWADGKVDPGGKTLSALQQSDPYPHQPLPSGGWQGKDKGGWMKGKQSQDPWGKTGGYKSPGGPGGKGPWGKDPWGKDPWGKDPSGKAGGYKSPGGPAGKDPWGKDPWAKDPWGKIGGKAGGGKSGF